MRKISFLTITLLLTAMLIISGCSGSAKKERQGSNGQAKTEDKTVYLVQTTPPNMLQQLKAKEIDGFIAWEPFNSVAVKEGYGKYLFKSPEVWDDHPCCVLAVGKDFDNAAAVEAIAWAHIKATRFINDPANKDKVLQYAAEFTGKDTEVVKAALENITYVEYPAQERFAEYYGSLVEGKLLKKSVKDIGFADDKQFFADFLKESVYRQVSDKLNKDAGWIPAPVPGGVKVRLGFLTGDLHQLALYVAEKEGYFKAVGLEKGKNYEDKVFPNGVAVMEAFKVKDIDVAYLGGAPATLKRINDDIPVEIIAGANNEGSALVVGSGAAVNSVADLGGKTIAVPGVGTVQYTLLEKALKKEGLNPVLK